MSAKKLKLQKLSNEKSKEYTNRLHKEITPLNEIYSKDRTSQDENIKGSIYHNINENWNKFFMGKFKENNRFYVSTKTAVMDMSIDDFDEEVLFEHYTIYNMDHGIADKFTKPDIDIIIIPYTIRIYVLKNGLKFLNKKLINEGITFSEIEYYGAHSCCVIINKFLRTLEFYDPNGSLSHEKISCDNLDEKMLFGEIYTILSKKRGGNDIENYRLYKNIDICPKIGPQNLREMSMKEREFKNRAKITGWCVVWSILNAFYRIKYYMVEPQILLEILLERIREMNDEEYWNWLRNWILHIMKIIELI